MVALKEFICSPHPFVLSVCLSVCLSVSLFCHKGLAKLISLPTTIGFSLFLFSLNGGGGRGAGGNT